MDRIETETLSPDETGIARAVAIWRKGGLVAFPTETVYGLGADACNGAAVARIFAAKNRPAFNPLIIHVADLASARRFAHFSDVAERLAAAFWPGPLSLVLPVRKGAWLSPLVTAGLDSVAVRVPQTPLARALLAAFGGAIAAPSANPSGTISPTTAAHVLQGLAGRIDAVMDGGAAQVGLESTIVHPDLLPPALLRPGGLPAEAIEAVLGCTLQIATNAEKPLSPGQLLSHYAPKSRLRLDQATPPDGWFWLGFGRICKGADLNLSASGDLVEAAANLFAMLHKADDIARRDGLAGIAIAPVPDHGLGAAINDRLARAAAEKI
ncbi:MAG: threonylcarbamoyl-AMP synthase [Rhodobacteraceae bacterium]|nr:threonylcarbamoyl-AMP synthase [Paracoccaceae bacterium]